MKEKERASWVSLKRLLIAVPATAMIVLVVLLPILTPDSVPLLGGGATDSEHLSPYNGSGGSGLVATYNDIRISNSTNEILTYLEGSFSALVMLLSGALFLIFACLRRFRISLLFLLLAVLAFLIRVHLASLFNDSGIV